tara:strand:- start:188 stop:1012 length:825 start_codon:yes stop_codon:yes gene_type:complete
MKYFKLILICAFLVVSNSYAQTKIMTYNIRYSTPNDGENYWELRKDEIVELLEYYNPDFIGIQEAMPSQLNFIAKNLDAYNYIGHGRDGLNTDSEGIPIFYNRTKYELVEEKVFWLSETPEKVSRGWDAALNRIVVHGVFRNLITNQTIDIVNTHFDHKGEISRLKSAELLIDYLRKNNLTDKRIVLMGDFNCLPTESPIKLLESELKSSYRIKGFPVYGPFGTFNGFDTIETVTKKIDYIFTKNITIKKYRCIDDRRKNNLYLSDHFPIMIEI